MRAGAYRLTRLPFPQGLPAFIADSATIVAPVQDTTTQAPDATTSPQDSTTPPPQRRRLLQGGGGEGGGGVSTLSPDENCFKCPPGTVSYISNNTGHAGIDACACPAGFSAPHSRAGQTGCGDDPCCGAPCPNTSILNSTNRKLGLAFCVDGNECLEPLIDPPATRLEDWLGSSYMPNHCHTNATCLNTFGSYSCDCNNGSYGNGFTCTSCPAFTTSNHASTTKSQCSCSAGLQCGHDLARRRAHLGALRPGLLYGRFVACSEPRRSCLLSSAHPMQSSRRPAA